MLCSFIEDIFIYRINSDLKLKSDFDKISREKGSCIKKARKVLVANGYKKLNNIEGIKYVYDMYWIRNRFVHNKGEATKEIGKIRKKYDFIIEKNKILLGEKFIENYIAHLEKFAVEVAEIIYENESRTYKILKEYPNLSESINRYLDLMKNK